jgi:DNA-binding MarR family transcriptional regulator
VEALLRPYGITGPQYNVLRILRGAENGLCRNEVRDRMLTRMPDMTRLLDRMEAAGLVRRERSDEDRRQVSTHITAAGRKVLEEVARSMDELHKQQLGHLSRNQLASVVELMTLIRSTV